MSGLLSVNGMKVLHVDQNNYYGGDSASLSITKLCEKFGKPKPTEDKYGNLLLTVVIICTAIAVSVFDAS